MSHKPPSLLSLELVVFDYIARDDIKWQSELQMRSNAALLIVTRNIVSSIENRKQVTDWFSSLVEALCWVEEVSWLCVCRWGNQSAATVKSWKKEKVHAAIVESFNFFFFFGSERKWRKQQMNETALGSWVVFFFSFCPVHIYTIGNACSVERASDDSPPPPSQPPPSIFFLSLSLSPSSSLFFRLDLVDEDVPDETKGTIGER